MLIGAISDTHGRADPGLAEAFAGVELILHAGDVGDPRVLHVLGEIAPVRAVRGNVDLAPWALELPIELAVDLPGGEAYIIHILGSPERPTRAVRRRLTEQPPRLLLYGHTHDPHHEVRDGIHFLNPGSAGPARFDKRPTCARLEWTAVSIDVEWVRL